MNITTKFGLLTLGLAMSSLLLAVQATVSAVGYTSLELPLARAEVAQRFVPEGWAFFTRSPREPRLHFYSPNQDGWREITEPPISHATHLFGLLRRARRQGVESALLLASLDDQSLWSECKVPDLPHCLANTEPSKTLTNPAKNPSLCGEIGFVRAKAVPFSWAQGLSRAELMQFATPALFVKAEIQCQ